MNKEQFTFIKTDKKLIKLYFDDVTVIRGLGNYVEISTLSEKKYVYYKSLRDLIDNLPDEFMRVHNSYIVNMTNIDLFEDNHIFLKGQKVAVGKSYRDCLQSTFSKFLL